MDLGLAGKSVIVTGGGSNIGRAIVFGLAAEGAMVTVGDIDPEQAGKVAEAANRAGPGQVQVVPTDVTRLDQAKFTGGGVRVDELAGPGRADFGDPLRRETLLADQPGNEWAVSIQVRLTGNPGRFFFQRVWSVVGSKDLDLALDEGFEQRLAIPGRS